MKYDYGGGYPVLIVFGVLLPVFAFLNRRERHEKCLLETVALLIFAAALILSFIFSQAKAFGFSEVLAYLLAICFYLIFAHGKNFPQKILTVIKFSAVVGAMIGFYFYIMRAEPRMFGPFFNKVYHSHVWPNAFALFLVMVWPLFLAAKRKIWPIVFIGFLLSALLLTYSRGALIVLGGQLFLLLIYFRRKLNLKNAGKIMLTALLAAGIFFGTNYIRALRYDVIDVKERASFGNNESLTSKRERVDFWLGSIQLIKEKPFFGWGPYSFREAYNPIQKTFLGTSDHPHNVFLKIGAENGLIALSAYLVFLAAIFVTVVRRFGSLDKDKKDFVYILGVAIAGSFAHNLIDYNFNFFENLLLLFILLAMVRSIVVKKNEKKNISVNIFAVLLALICWYEGTILLMQEFKDPAYLGKSLFPRYYYSTYADKAIQRNDLGRAAELLDRQLQLDPLDAQSWYLQGVIACRQKNQGKCRTNLQQAMKLNPMNDLIYYRDYLKITDDPEILQKAFDLVQNYFQLVEYNVHFTGYTGNVEAASGLIDILMKKIPMENWNGLPEKRKRMLEKAMRLRETKTF
ncbi:O-antigen ligase family protein [Candidatus Peregrinibacteria bacterium]|nr:O-antigen ligase family protein [Candidatus Peregrinibacteria bacterium]